MRIGFVLLFAVAASGQTQIDRGKALFMDAQNGCATCHALKGEGTAVGPDLKGIAVLQPAGIAMAIRSTVTQYVQMAKLKSGESFPTMPPSGSDPKVKLYDLSKMPPELHEVDKADVGPLTPNNSWKHPPATRNYTPAQMADIIAYVKYAATNSRKAVDPADVQ